jgi:hypothetical protein
MKVVQASTLLVLWIQSALGKADLEHPNVTLTKIAFGSCHKSKYPSAEQWRRIRDEKAQVRHDLRFVEPPLLILP